MKTACIVYMLWYILHVTYVAMAFLYSISLHVSWAVLSKTPQATPSVNVADHAMVWLASSPVILLLIIMIMSVDVMLITLSISNMHQTFLEENQKIRWPQEQAAACVLAGVSTSLGQCLCPECELLLL